MTAGRFSTSARYRASSVCWRCSVHGPAPSRLSVPSVMSDHRARNEDGANGARRDLRYPCLREGGRANEGGGLENRPDGALSVPYLHRGRRERFELRDAGAWALL